MLSVGQIATAMEGRFDPPGQVIGRIAGVQHGVLARWQLLAAGVPASAIDRRLNGWNLIAIYPGVYAVGHRSLSRYGEWLAAALAGGERAMLSHRSAAALLGIADDEPGLQIEITVPHEDGGGRRISGLAIHRSRLPLDEARVERQAIPVTTIERTLIDLAGARPDRLLVRAFHAADRLELLDLRALGAACERARGKRGVRRVTGLIAAHREMPFTRSELERMFLRLCDRAGIKRPAVNVEIERFEVDCVWPPERLVVELDSYGFHRDRASFEADRIRDARLQLAGYRVLRITWRRLVDSPDEVAAEVRTLLSAPGPSPGGSNQPRMARAI
jgi:very-short-patch-repair endonuclease